MEHEETQSCGVTAARRRWILAGFLAVAAFFLWTEHRAHVLGILPYLFILACPLMHLMHGHGRHHHERDESQRSDARENGPARGRDAP